MLNDFISDIVCEKQGNLFEYPENELFFNSFLIQRIISMYSPQLCNIINETTNKKISVLSKEEIYKLLITIIPRQKNSFTKYFKKKDQEIVLSEKENKYIKHLCEVKNCSHREIKQYINNFDLNINFFET